MKDIVARYGVHRATVTEILRRAKVSVRRYGLPEPVREEAARLYTQGLGSAPSLIASESAMRERAQTSSATA